mmetsp:Transcript_39243/g.67944  ORF Transcript_39243/g.67944 Transcript_39243/m.67944 type:complete len:232 (-) Transcript_39243:1559-2254(-)
MRLGRTAHNFVFVAHVQVQVHTIGEHFFATSHFAHNRTRRDGTRGVSFISQPRHVAGPVHVQVRVRQRRGCVQTSALLVLRQVPKSGVFGVKTLTTSGERTHKPVPVGLDRQSIIVTRCGLDGIVRRVEFVRRDRLRLRVRERTSSLELWRRQVVSCGRAARRFRRKVCSDGTARTQALSSVRARIRRLGTAHAERLTQCREKFALGGSTLEWRGRSSEAPAAVVVRVRAT